jgi:opacity protein-like surface antigen
MKKLLLGTTALVTSVGAHWAAAADLPRKAPPPISAYNWSGFYIGAEIGGAVGTANVSDPFGASIFGDKVTTPGFLAGGQIGYNWQVPNSPWVLGLQADANWLTSDGTNTCSRSAVC